MRRMLYKLLIICLFLILCILLIYFLKKNKQIEKFDEEDDERQKKIIIKMGGQTSTDQKIFKYYNNSIEFVRSVEESEGTVEALFYDESLTDPKLTTKTITTYNNIIQVINVALDVSDTTSYKTFYLKNDQKVYDRESASATAIITYTNIIQITPHKELCFLCLTNSNTLIKITLSSSSPGSYSYNENQVDTTPPYSEDDPISIIENTNTPTSPIISIKGFRRLDCVLYLCMNGDLFYLNTDLQQSKKLKPKVIQFNVPTDSDLSTTDNNEEIWYSCIAIDNNIKKVYFNKFNLNDNTFVNRGYHIIKDDDESVNIHSTWITCTSTSPPISYQYYIICNIDNVYKLMNVDVDSDSWQTNAVDNMSLNTSSVFTEIDDNIKSIISYNNELYYLKNGEMKCTDPFFTHSDGVQCVSCGSNGSQITDSDNCQCDTDFSVVDTNNIINNDNTRYSATTSSYGCYSCPTFSCPAGFYKSNIDVNIDNRFFKECHTCQLCTGLPSSANAKIKRNIYTTGVLSGSNDTSYNEDSNYYIMHECTPESDTIFGQVTRWDDLASGDSNYYYSSNYYTGGYTDYTDTPYNIINFNSNWDFNTDWYSNNSPYNSIMHPVYNPITGLIDQYAIDRNNNDMTLPTVNDNDINTLENLLTVGNDVEFTDCDPRADTCGTYTDDEITSSGGTLCTNGTNLNCDNLCSNVYRCYHQPDSYDYDIFTTWFSSPSGEETTINEIIDVCDSVRYLFETKNPRCFDET